VIWYLWQIRTAVKYIQILRQHTTHKEKKHQRLFATTRKLNKKHTHFLKEAFLYLFLFFLIGPSRILEGITYLHFLFVSVSLFCYFKRFCTRICYLKQASQALVNVTDMFSFCRDWIWTKRTSGTVKTEFVYFCNMYFFLSFVCSLFFLFLCFVWIFYQNVTDINISSTPQIGSHGHKRTPDCYTKGHSKVKNHVIYIAFFLFLIETSA